MKSLEAGDDAMTSCDYYDEDIDVKTWQSLSAVASTTLLDDDDVFYIDDLQLQHSDKGNR